MLSRPGSARPIAWNVLRPITIGLPIVSARNRFRSSEMCHGSAPPRPIARLVPSATTRTSAMGAEPFRNAGTRRYTQPRGRQARSEPRHRARLRRSPSNFHRQQVAEVPVDLADRVGIGAEEREMPVDGPDRPELGIGNEAPLGLAVG